MHHVLSLNLSKPSDRGGVDFRDEFSALEVALPKAVALFEKDREIRVDVIRRTSHLYSESGKQIFDQRSCRAFVWKRQGTHGYLVKSNRKNRRNNNSAVADDIRSHEFRG